LVPAEKIGECWEEYACQTWRSYKAKELDTLGGGREHMALFTSGNFCA
jgi:hypothetical protein